MISGAKCRHLNGEKVISAEIIRPSYQTSNRTLQHCPKEGAARKERGGQQQEHTLSTAVSVNPASTEAADKNPIWGNDKPRSMKEASTLAGMRLGTLRQKVYRREIESVMVGRERQIQPSAMRAYFARQKRPAL